jgi:3-oxoacyl-[acyl-carrier-protein] synthase-3
VGFSAIHAHGQPGLWQPAAYLQHRLGAAHAMAWTLSFGCNGLMLGLMQAAMLQPAMRGPALLVGADRFEGTDFDRWTSDRGLAYGDAACGMLVSSQGGFAELNYLGVEFLPELEAMHRPDALDTAGAIWDVTACKRAYLERYGGKAFFDRLELGLDRLEAGVSAFLEQRNISLAGVVTPFVGRSVRSTTYDARFHPMARVNATGFGSGIGHTGTCDPLLGLAHLVDTRAVVPGDHVLLIGAGAGFSLSATVLRLDRIPQCKLLGEI